MQCVILAGGKGKRLRPLTNSIPKPLVPVAGKPLLDHIVSVLPSEVEELIIVHGYRGQQIKDHCGSSYYGRPVTYVEQKEQKGTGHALWLTKDLVRGKFLYMFADDLHGADDIARAVSYPRSILTLPTDKPERFGIVSHDDDGILLDIIEKPENPPSNLASTGVFVLDENIFAYPPTTETNGELVHVDMIREYAKLHPMQVVKQNFWHPVGYPEDVVSAEAVLHSREEQKSGLEETVNLARSSYSMG